MPGYTVLTCPSCGAKASLEVGAVTATCQFCGSQLILDPALAAAAAAPNPTTTQVPLVPLPAGVEAHPGASDLTLTRRWYSPKYIFLAFFAVAWDAFLLFWYGMAFAAQAPLFFSLFPLLHLAVGVYLTYSTLAGFVNTSTVQISGSRVVISHGPLPWPGGLDLPASDIRQVYVREIVSHSRRSTSVSYTLSAVLTNGRGVDLLKGLDQAETGRYIEQQVEQYLRIPDTHVAGEIGK